MGFVKTRSFVLVVGLALFQLLAAPGSEALKVLLKKGLLSSKPSEQELAAQERIWQTDLSSAESLLKKHGKAYKNWKWALRLDGIAVRNAQIAVHKQNWAEHFAKAKERGFLGKSAEVAKGSVSYVRAYNERTRWVLFGPLRSWTFFYVLVAFSTFAFFVLWGLDKIQLPFLN